MGAHDKAAEGFNDGALWELNGRATSHDSAGMNAPKKQTVCGSRRKGRRMGRFLLLMRHIKAWTDWVGLNHGGR